MLPLFVESVRCKSGRRINFARHIEGSPSVMIPKLYLLSKMPLQALSGDRGFHGRAEQTTTRAAAQSSLSLLRLFNGLLASLGFAQPHPALYP
jgi:hypothetical protein